MFLDFIGDTLAEMRDYAGFSEEQLANKIGKSEATIKRLEANDRETVLKRELWLQIVEATGVTRPILAGIVARTAGGRLGQRLAVLPPDAMVPSIEASKAIRMFSHYADKLDPREQGHIKSLVIELRCQAAESERTTITLANFIIARINNARIELGEDPSDDPED